MAATGASGTPVPTTDDNVCKSTGGITPSTVLGSTAGEFPNGDAWWWGRSGQTRYVHLMPPNSFNCNFGGDSGDSDDDAITVSSRHPGGVNCVFIDGSVRFVKATVTLNAWWAISTIGGGEIVSADQY